MIGLTNWRTSTDGFTVYGDNPRGQREVLLYTNPNRPADERREIANLIASLEPKRAADPGVLRPTAIDTQRMNDPRLPGLQAEATRLGCLLLYSIADHAYVLDTGVEVWKLADLWAIREVLIDTHAARLPE